MPQTIQILRSLEAKKRPNPATLLPGQLAANINPAEPGLYFSDTAGNLRKVGPCHIGPVPPNSGVLTPLFAGNCIGEMWYDTAGGELKIWSGSAWIATQGGGTRYSIRTTVTASAGTYTVNATLGNEFVTGAAIAGATVVNLSNLASIPTGAVWRAVLSFEYTSGVINWFPGNTGFTVRWDGGSAISPTAGETETIAITVVGGTTVIDVAFLLGRNT